MKRLCLIIGTLLAVANASANNNLTSSTRDNANTEMQNVEYSCKDCLLNLSKEAKVVISDNEGHVVFYCENVEMLDMTNWQQGSYVATINDHDTITFTL